MKRFTNKTVLSGLLLGSAFLAFLVMGQGGGVPHAFAACTTWTGPATVADTCITIPYNVSSIGESNTCTIFGDACAGGTASILVNPQAVSTVSSPVATGGKGEPETITSWVNTLPPAQGESCAAMQTQTPPGCPAFIGSPGSWGATFTIDTSAYANGPYTASLSVFDSLAGQRSFSIPFQVFHGVSPGGTVSVTSENSVTSTGQLVPSRWNFAGSVADPCAGNGAACSGTNVSYPGQPAGSVADQYILNVSPASAGAGYSLRSIKQNIAQAAPIPALTPKNSTLAFFENFFATAHASVVCGFLDSNPSSCPTPANAFTLVGPSDIANFIILWDPIANMGPITTPITLNSSTLSQVVSVTNNGSAGSVLSWTAGPPTYSGAGGWLAALSPPSGSVTGGNSQNVTFTANPAAVPPGSYSATVTFTATSAPGVPASGNPLPPQTVTVNFTNGAGVSPVKIISTTPGSTVSATTPITAVCSGGSGAYAWTASGPAIPGSGAGANFTFSYLLPSLPGPPYTLTCIDANNPNSTDSEPITITQVTPACGFAANPPQIVVPGSSTLSWTCVNAVSCSIGGISVNPVRGTFSVSPVSNTTYTLFCNGPGSGPGSMTSVQTTVSVVGPGIIEGPPGGK